MSSAYPRDPGQEASSTEAAGVAACGATSSWVSPTVRCGYSAGVLIGATRRYALAFALGGLLTAANLLTYRALADLHSDNDRDVADEGACRATEMKEGGHGMPF